MLNWLSSKLKQESESDHPLGTDAALKAIVSELHRGRPESNLHELADWLAEPLRISESMLPTRALRAIQTLDEAAQIELAAVWKSFLAESQIDHIAEKKLKALDEYYKAAISANRHGAEVVMRHPEIAGSTAGAANLVSLLLARALRAQVALARTQHLRYRKPNTAWWASSAELLGFASRAGALNLVQATYPGETPPSSPWLEHLLGLFFETAPLGNFNPQQMDLLARVLRKLEPHFTVRDSFSQQAPFRTRIDSNVPPAKLSASPPPDPGNIYFGAGMAYGHLIRLRSQLYPGTRLPTWMADSLCSPELAIVVIDGLIMHWSERPPKRQSSRAARMAAVRATHGLAQVRRMVAFSEFARSGRKVGYRSHLESIKFSRRSFADVSTVTEEEEEARWSKATPIETLEILETAGDRQMTDEWTLQDESETGIGAVAPFLKPWMVIGRFIGYRVEDEIDWRVGILRRVHRKESGHPSVGLEIFPETPVCAQVKEFRLAPGASPLAELNKDAAMGEFLDAIVISQSKGLIMVPKGLFAHERYLALSIGGTREAIRMNALMHSDGDCDCIQFETVDD